MVMRSLAWRIAGKRSRKKASASLWNRRKGIMFHLLINCLGLKTLVVFADEDGGAEDGAPQAALIADGGLRDVHGADDFIGDAVDLFFLVPGKVGIEFHVEGGCEHLRGQLFGVLAGNFLGFAEGVMLRQIAVHGFVAGEG